MPRFIFSDTRDELIQKRNAWKMKYDARQQLYNDQERNYNRATKSWVDNLKNIVNKQFSSYISKLPGLRINVDRYWGVRIRFEYEPRRDNTSLKWSYEVILDGDTGDLKKESNSWSGFQAVTSEQIDDLMNSANFLKAIVDFDWASLFEEAQRNQPQYKNYIGIRNPQYDPEYKDPGYDRMIRDAEIDEAVESGKWVKGTNSYGGATWVFVVSQTPKFYNIVTVRESDIRHTGPNSPYYEELADRIHDPKNASSYWKDRVKKDNISFANPIETKTPDELLELAGTDS